MCGIAGFYRIGMPTERKEQCLAAMTDALRHRGPDGGNMFIQNDVALGHRRLSIIAPDQSANQPMTRGPLTIVYNGELYNYREEKVRLQSNGIAFRTESDTEVLLALYESEGTACFKRLNGIFAFAIYDERTGRIVCARDHFGIKPFLYAQKGQGIIFASELKSLLAGGLVERAIDKEALTLLLKTGSVPQPYTMLEGVKALLPGHYIICSENGIHIERYYKPSLNTSAYKNDRDWQDAIHESLRASVKEQLVSDVPLGAFLSGGVDSAMIVALMKEITSDVKTYSVGFENPETSDQYDETIEAADMARHLHTDHHTFTVTDAEAKNALPDIIKGLDHPTIDGGNSYFVSKITAQHVRVALSGTGADEIFGGYAWFGNMQRYQNAGLLEKIKYAVKGQNYLTYYKSLHGAFSEQSAYELLGRNFIDAEAPLQYSIGDAKGLARTSDLVMASFLQNQLLPDIDTASMAHALEVRVPYLSMNMVELALSAPDHLKAGPKNPQAPAGSYEAEGTKKILVDIAKQYLPKGFEKRPKRGFAMPMARWLDTIWKDQLQEATSLSTLKSRGLFDPDVIHNLNKAGHSTMPWPQSWLLMAVELWCRDVLDDKRRIA